MTGFVHDSHQLLGSNANLKLGSGKVESQGIAVYVAETNEAVD